MASESQGTLSKRGAQLASESPMAPYIQAHFERAAERWHPTERPDGYVSLCVAENSMMQDLLVPRLQPKATPPARVLGYDAMVGALEFRTQLARFMGRTFLGRTFDPEHVAVLAGAGTVLENLFYAIADPGDAVLVPTPSYAGFWTDLETRDDLHIVPVHCPSHDRFTLTTERLDAAWVSTNRLVRALLFTNPDNPTGAVATPDEIRLVLRWAESRGIHVVFDEIYALSVFGTTPFTSVASITESLGDHVHIVWAFSKDFAASGLRCGVLVSENKAVQAAVDGLAYWGAVSGHTQWLLGQMLSDDAFITHYCTQLKTRLAKRYAHVTQALTEAGIPTLPAEAGIFVLCDLRGYLEEPTAASEHALWRRLLDEANANITPGSACRIPEPGFFRLCYASEPLDAVLEGIRRVAAVLNRTA